MQNDSISRFVIREEHQYAPFVGAAFVSALVGFSLGLLVAHAAASGSSLGGRAQQLTQVHGQFQLFGWFGLFVMGMGYRLVSRFTAVKHPYNWLPPLTIALAAAGLTARGFGQAFAGDGALFQLLFALSGVLQLLAAVVFAGVVLRAVLLGRPDQSGYKWYFASGVVWLAAAMALNCYLCISAVTDDLVLVPRGRSQVVAFLLLYGFVSMFVFAVSTRTVPVFFGRRQANPAFVRLAWVALNLAIPVYAAASYRLSFETSDSMRALQSAGFVLAGAGALAVIATIGIFGGVPHRLRPSARRNMRFVISAYAWLALAAVLHVYYGATALLNDRPLAAFEVDAVRHFIAIGFLTTITVGMAFLVMPALAMRRLGGRSVSTVALVLLALLHGAAASRGLGSLVVNEGHFDEGYWTMTVGGTLGLLAIAVFVGYILWKPKPGETIEVSEVGRGAP
jgi:hypothetical protein